MKAVARPGTDPDVRRHLSAGVATEGTGWLLWAWREAARGNDAEELALLWVLHGARIGAAAPEQPVAAELDARLDAVSKATLVHPEEVERTERAWLTAPEDRGAGRRWWRVALAAGRSPVGTDVLQAPVEDGPSEPEAAFLVLADAVALAATSAPDDAVAAAAATLATIEDRYGRVVQPEAVGPPLATVLAGASDPGAVRAAYVSHRQQVLTRLLRSVQLPPRRAASHTSVEGGAGRRLRRVLLGFAVSAAIATLIAVLPRSVPALPDADLVPRGQREERCRSCPPDEQLTAIGWELAEDRVRVTVELAAVPEASALTVLLGDGGEAVTVHRSDDRWRIGASTDPGFRVDRVQVLSDRRTVVVELPARAAPDGVAVSTGGGDRLPAEGFVPAAAGASPSPNVVDLAVAAVLVYAGVRGFRQGLLRTMPALVGFVLTLMATRLLYPPLGALILGRLTHLPRLANSVAVAVLLALVGSGLYLAGGAAVTAGLRRLSGRVPVRRGSALDRTLGAGARAVRATATVATTLTLALNLAAVTALAPLLRRSVLGRAAVALWRNVFPGL